MNRARRHHPDRPRGDGPVDRRVDAVVPAVRWPVRRRLPVAPEVINGLDPRRRARWAAHDRDDARPGRILPAGRDADATPR